MWKTNKSVMIYNAAESEVIRKRMLNLVGTDVCRINDPQFMELLSTRVREEYETGLILNERLLADKEKQRERHLVQLGIVTPQELREYDSRRSDKRKKTLQHENKSDHRLVQEKPRPAAHHDKEKEKHRPNKQDDKKEKTEESEEQKDDTGEDKAGEQEKSENDETQEQNVSGEKKQMDDNDEGWHCDTDKTNKARNEDPLITKFRNQKSTDGIYHAAKEVIAGKECGEDCAYK